MPAADRPDVYSSWIGLMYVFNLIVGTGALTLPSVFAKAGWLLSLILLIALAFVSFITVTFIIETMACANATLQIQRLESHKIDGESEVPVDSESEDATTEETAIINNRRNRSRYFSLNQKVELGEMTGLYFNKTGRILFFISLCVYLYGDLAIYAAAISKSMCDLVCPNNRTTNISNLADDEFNIDCFNDRVHKIDLYRIFVAIFALLIGPFTYFDVQKTKYFQITTTSMRWCAFSIMIALASVRLYKYGQLGSPGMVTFNGVPAMIGASVYSFMCHHSLPALIAPFAEKQHVVRQVGLDYLLICCFYLLLALTGAFAFKDLNDLYTLNFVPSSDDQSNAFLEFILYFLGMFPVFTLSTSFPIIAITLQNNLKSLFLDPNLMDHYNFVLRRLTFPTLAVIPPIIVAFCTHNLRSLVEFTGAYAGVCIQYIIPTYLVWAARKHCKKEFGGAKNKYSSPFKGNFWVVFVLAWAFLSISLVSVNLITQ